MSISQTIKQMRKAEIMADIPKMNINELISRRTELKSILYNKSPTESQLDKQSIADITIEISRELNNRAEAEQVKNGTDPDSQSKAIIAGAKDKRKHGINKQAETKLSQARFTFDGMTANQQLDYVEQHGKNPHEQTIADFGGSE